MANPQSLACGAAGAEVQLATPYLINHGQRLIPDCFKVATNKRSKVGCGCNISSLQLNQDCNCCRHCRHQSQVNLQNPLAGSGCEHVTQFADVTGGL